LFETQTRRKSSNLRSANQSFVHDLLVQQLFYSNELWLFLFFLAIFPFYFNFDAAFSQHTICSPYQYPMNASFRLAPGTERAQKFIWNLYADAECKISASGCCGFEEASFQFPENGTKVWQPHEREIFENCKQFFLQNTFELFRLNHIHHD
jgi:hypothetical protein